MFYSPKKNIEAFIEAKNEEIKTLKQKILGTRVTYEQMDDAKLRLNKLKSSQITLEKEDFEEMKGLLRSTHQAVTDLVEKKNRLSEELGSRKKDSHEMSDIMDELTSKK